MALGVALLVEGVFDLAFGANAYSFPSFLSGPSLQIFGADVSQGGLLLIGITLVVTGALVWVFRRTLVGHAMTAVSENPSVSSLLGVDIARMRQLSYGLAGALGSANHLQQYQLVLVCGRSNSGDGDAVVGGSCRTSWSSITFDTSR